MAAGAGVKEAGRPLQTRRRLQTCHLQIVCEIAEIELTLLHEIVELDLVLLVLLVAPADSPPAESELVLLVLLVAPADSPPAESETRIKALLRLH